MICFGVVDNAVGKVVLTFNAESEAMGLRSFKNLFLTEQDTVFNSNPEDFSLVKIADLNSVQPFGVIAKGDSLSFVRSERSKLFPEASIDLYSPEGVLVGSHSGESFALNDFVGVIRFSHPMLKSFDITIHKIDF